MYILLFKFWRIKSFYVIRSHLPPYPCTECLCINWTFKLWSSRLWHIVAMKSHLNYDYYENVKTCIMMLGLLVFLFHILYISSSYLTYKTGCSDWGCLWFPSVPISKCWVESYFKLQLLYPTFFLTHHPYSCCPFTLYRSDLCGSHEDFSFRLVWFIDTPFSCY
jgi:hypothetical protein